MNSFSYKVTNIWSYMREKKKMDLRSLAKFCFLAEMPSLLTVPYLQYLAENTDEYCYIGSFMPSKPAAT